MTNAVPPRTTEPSLWSRAAMRLLGLDSCTLQELSRFVAKVHDLEANQPLAGGPNQATRRGAVAAIRAQLGRVGRWRELANAAWNEQDLQKACAYELRIMRLLGEDAQHRLTPTINALKQLEYVPTVDAALALYARDESKRRTACNRLLQDELDSHLQNPLPVGGVLADARTAAKPRVSLIVSLYQAADKLEHFLRQTSQQSLARRGGLELVLIDSASPTDERTVIERLAPELGLSYVYYRTREREPIALAWNRGLALAQGEYIAFWGVDEGGQPTALEELADFLDQHLDVDWVQADATAYEVDRDGAILGASREYRRHGFCREAIYLNHQYLTYVGALYRKSIHDRCGYFDPALRAAGDTEFKYRALPHINAAYLPAMLGCYWNYSEERLTEHPRAEIEDVRAYDLHHSAAGVQYAFPEGSAEQLWKLLCLALKFRPCMDDYFATDLDYAMSVAKVLSFRGDLSLVQRSVARSLMTCQKRYRAADRPTAGWQDFYRAGAAAYHLQRIMRRHSAGQFQPAAWFFNDARFSRYYRPW